MSPDTIIKQIDRLKSDRSALDQRLDECAAFSCPEKMGVLCAPSSEGEDNRPRHVLIDEISEANAILARGLYSNLCPPSARWFAFAPAGKVDKENQVLRDFFQRAGETLYELLMKTNFSTELAEAFEDFGWAGTVNLYCESDAEKRCFHFENHHISEYWIDVNHRKEIDTVYREFKLTAQQFIDMFSMAGDTIPSKVREDATSQETARNNNKYSVIHAVFPNRERKMDADGKWLPGNKNKAFKSVYVCRETKETVRDSGYDENPYTVARFEKKALMNYGYSPAMRVLRTAKVENKVWTTLLKSGEKTVDPPVLLDARSYGGISPQFFYNPRAVNVYDGSKGNKPEFQPIPANIPYGLEIFDRLDRHIDAAYFVNMFQMIQQINEQSGRQRTAYEIMNLVSEKNSMIIPVVSRILDELFKQLLTKCFFMALRNGWIEWPESLPREKPLSFEITFDSPLSLAARRIKLNALGDGMAMIEPLAAIDPGVVDIINTDKAARTALEIAGVSPDFIRSRGEVEELRKQRAAAAQQQNEVAMAMELAKGQNLTQKPEGGSPAAGAMEALFNGRG